MTNIHYFPERTGSELAPYSQGVDLGDFVILAGQVSIDDNAQVVHAYDFPNQAKHVLWRIERLLDLRGLSVADVVTASICLTDRENYAALNAAWSEFFGDYRPVRTLIVADLVIPSLLLEVQVTARRAV